MNKLTSRIAICLSILGLVLGWNFNAQAGPKKEEAKKEELPKQGSLSTSISGRNTNSTSVNDPWGGVDPSGKESAPIAGSVSRGEKGWSMKLFNNSAEDTYSVSVRVVQLNNRDVSVKTDSYSYTLKPNQSVEREISSAPTAARADLKLDKWKNLTSKKKEVEKESAAAEEALESPQQHENTGKVANPKG